MAIIHLKRLRYEWKELSRGDKTSIITAAMMKHIYINGNGYRIGMREIIVHQWKKEYINCDINT